MTSKPTDRRIQRTNRRLKRAILELIDERDFESITVEEIVERADVGRSTFYSHFTDKEDLLFRGFDEWLISLVEVHHAGDGNAFDADRAPAFRFSLPLLRHMAQQERFFLAAIFQASTPRIRQKTLDLLARVVGVELERLEAVGRGAGKIGKRARDAELAREGRSYALASGFLGLAGWWLTTKPGLSAERVDEIFQEVAQGVAEEGGSTRNNGHVI